MNEPWNHLLILIEGILLGLLVPRLAAIFPLVRAVAIHGTARQKFDPHKAGLPKYDLPDRAMAVSRDAAEQSQQYQGVAIDMGDRKLAEAVLYDSERPLRQMMDALPVYLAYIDSDQRYRFVNRMYEKRFGCDRCEIQGKSIRDLLGETTYSTIAAYLEQALKGKTVSYFVEQPDDRGEVRCFDVVLVPDWDAHGAVRGCFSLVIDVTAQRISEEALRQSDERFRAAFDTTAVGMAIVAPNGSFLEVNAALCQILGYPEAELLECTFQNLTYPEDLNPNIELLHRILAGEISYYHLEKRYIHRQGHLVWCLLSVSLVRDAQGQPLYLVSQLQDITERKRAEQVLQEREAQLRSISNNIPRGVLYQLIHDPQENSLAFSYISDGVKDLLGISAEAVMQDIDVLYELLPEDEREQVDRLTQTSLEHLTNFEAEVKQRNLQGAIVWAAARAVPRRLPDGRTVWDGVAVDITSLKEAEAALRQSETKMRAILEAIPDLVLVADRQGNGLAYHNGGDVVVLKQVVQQQESVSVFDALPEPLAQERLRYIQKALDTREMQTHEYELFIDHEIHCEEARIVASGADEVVVFVRDMTAAKRREVIRQQFEAELKRAKETAEAANQAKSTFLSHVSHELRSPLNTLLGYAQLLARSKNLTATQREYLEVLNRSGTHLSQIINDVLSLSRIEAGRVTVRQSIVQLPDLLENVQSIFQMRAVAQGLELTLSLAADVPKWVVLDEGKLRQVLINLLDNAIKFTPQGSITLSVTLKAAQILQFSVTDTGVGIAPEDLNAIFEAFVQTESGERSRQGSGLGLTISARLVQMMGGEISAESQPGQGTTLQFTLPFMPTRSEALETAEIFKGDRLQSPLQRNQPSRQVIGLAPGEPQYRILVVDDIAANADLAVQWLMLIGFKVKVAQTGIEAIEQWKAFEPDLIWMDLRMPELDGLEATARIRALEQEQQARQKTKIIAVSATVFEEERQSAFAAGCDAFVSKPYSEQDLLNSLQHHLNVNYQYEQGMTEMGNKTSVAALGAASSRAVPELNPADFQVMSPEWIARLNWAARAAREESIYQLLDQIPAEHQPLREAIAYWVSQFQFEQLIKITESLC